MSVTIGNRSVQVTASFGVAQRCADDDRVETLIDRADRALLAAKDSGRNRVVRSTSLVTQTAGESKADSHSTAADSRTRLAHSAQMIAQSAAELAYFVFNHADGNPAPTVDRANKLMEMINTFLLSVNQHSAVTLVGNGLPAQTAEPIAQSSTVNGI